MEEYFNLNKKIVEKYSSISNDTCLSLLLLPLMQPSGAQLPLPRVEHHQACRPSSSGEGCGATSQNHWNACPSGDHSFSARFGAQWSQ